MLIFCDGSEMLSLIQLSLQEYVLQYIHIENYFFKLQ